MLNMETIAQFVCTHQDPNNGFKSSIIDKGSIYCCTICNSEFRKDNQLDMVIMNLEPEFKEEIIMQYNNFQRYKELYKGGRN